MIGSINYLVGPNGSGKSRFATALLSQLKNRAGGARLLGTDRLREMANPGLLGRYWGDQLANGYAKNSFDRLRKAGAEGSGVDTILLLEDRMDLRIRIEGTLSHLFGRDVVLEWDSGNLVPKAVRRGDRPVVPAGPRRVPRHQGVVRSADPLVRPSARVPDRRRTGTESAPAIPGVLHAGGAQGGRQSR